MNDPIQPIRKVAAERRAEERREQQRRDRERRGQQGAGQTVPGKSNLPVLASQAKTAAPQAKAEAAAFAAQLLGQGGNKRGLRAGPPALEEARSAYLEAEWSGPDDRRKRQGRITKAEI